MKILVLCTGNSARSILLEAILNCQGNGRLIAYSAGSKPTGVVHPRTLKLLKNKGIINNFHSKSWEIFSKDSKITMDIIITVCGNARDEECPYWSGNPIRVHWGVPDPANVTGSNSEKQIAFETAYNTLEKKAKAFLDLEFEDMSHDMLQKNINNISRII